MIYCLYTPPPPRTHPHPTASLESLKVRPKAAEGQEWMLNLRTNEGAGPPSSPP